MNWNEVYTLIDNVLNKFLKDKKLHLEYDALQEMRQQIALHILDNQDLITAIEPNPNGYMTTIIRNKATDLLRREGARIRRYNKLFDNDSKDLVHPDNQLKTPEDIQREKKNAKRRAKAKIRKYVQ